MIPKTNTNNPSPVSRQPVLSQANQAQNNSVETAAPVTAQPTGWNPFSACLAVKNSVENSITNSTCIPGTKAEKLGFGVYWCTYMSVGAPAMLTAIPVLGPVAGILAGASLGSGVALASCDLAEKIVTQLEQIEVKKRE